MLGVVHLLCNAWGRGESRVYGLLFSKLITLLKRISEFSLYVISEQPLANQFINLVLISWTYVCKNFEKCFIFFSSSQCLISSELLCGNFMC